MKVKFLGTGTSTGVPQIGCKCKTCASLNPKDKRLRASLLIIYEDNKILIDCGPDFRQQFLINEIDTLDSVLITHEHYDHIGGIDDVRPFGNVNIYAENRVINVIKRNLPYCFGENKYPGVPKIGLNCIDESEFYLENLKVLPIRAMHAKLPILGYRIGNVAYLTDVKSIDSENLLKLRDLDTLIINALRIESHISHLSLNESLELCKMINAKRTFFTHMSHDIGLHDAVNSKLPDNIQLAYDGLTLDI